MLRVAINGCGRIGRCVAKVLWGNPEVEIVAFNDLAEEENLAYLFAHDSNYGAWNVPVGAKEGYLVFAGKDIPMLHEKDPNKLPWEALDVDVVIECTGLFLTHELAMGHIRAGARRVLLSAPAKDERIPVYVRGVNCDALAQETELIISNASCTTNCAAPLLAVLHEAFGIEEALLTTVHSYTASQALVDAPNKDIREGRSAAQNMVPTTTGATRAVVKVIPDLAGKLSGLSVRVPVASVSLVDVVCLMKRPLTKEQINGAFVRAAQEDRFAGIVGISYEPLVSSDYKEDSRSCIIDAALTQANGGALIKVVGWYDNEWGYAHRLAEIAQKIPV